MKDTHIKLTVNGQKVDATLNDTISAQDLIAKLPYTVKVNRASVDYCGILPNSLQHTSSEARRGWRNGDISYIPGADWIAFFFDGEEDSISDTNPQHIIGSANDSKAFEYWPDGEIEVLIELA